MSTKPEVIDLSNGVRIIDPNPYLHTIEHEDLYIYASLVAKTKGKSFLTETETGDFELENLNVSSVDMVVQDSYQEKNPKDGGTIKRQFLTTNWTEIGGSQTKGGETADAGDLEGFGITNIDIEIKGSYIPKVVIDFVDIRGATLFEQGSCSPYGLFFHLPYPIFELTLKGYYGKPVTYYLNLVKFNTKFNASTGNFECRAEFIGWSYAFLADILMGYIRCSGYMDKWGAQSKLREKYDNTIKYYDDNGILDKSDYLSFYEPNTQQVYVQGTNDELIQPFCERIAGDYIECMTIDKLLFRIQDVKDFLALAKADKDYIEVGGLLKVRTHLVKMQDKIRKFARLLEEDFKNQIKDGGPKLTEVPNRNLKEKYVFNGTPDDALKEYIKQYWSRPISGNENSGYSEITSYVPTAKEQLVVEDDGVRTCGGSHVAVLSAYATNNGLTNCGIYSTDEGEYYYNVLDFLDKDTRYKFQKGMMNFSDYGLNYKDVNNGNSDDYYIDLGWVFDGINKDIQSLDEKIEKKRNFVKDSIDAGVVRALGFRPTVRNIFTILCCNVENFMELLLDCSIQAEKEHNGGGNKEQYNERYGDQTGSQPDKLLEAQSRGGNNEDLKTIYPWPTYYNTQYRSASSANENDKSTETKEEYPGTNPDFFDWPEVRFVEDFIEACQKANDAQELLEEDKTGKPGFDDYTPINPLESKLIDAGIECKYHEATLSLGVSEDALDEQILLTIAERMFVTLDFSYFDPIRYSPINIGLGYSFSPRDSGKPDKAGSSEGISFSSYQKDRLWLSTLYKNNYDFLDKIARIDAHNLFSCITKTEQLSKLNLAIGGVGKEKFVSDIENLLQKQVDNRTSVDTNDLSLGWFNTSAKSELIYPKDIEPKNFLKTNLDKYEGWVTDQPTNINEWQDDYWAYQPNQGYINFVGQNSLRGYGEKNNKDSVRIYSDIRKMRSDYLFRLIDSEDDELLNNGFTIKYKETNDKIFKQRTEELIPNLVAELKKTATAPDCTEAEMGAYDINDPTKLICYNEKNDPNGLRLFTTLSIGNATNSTGGYGGFDIEFALLPYSPGNVFNPHGSVLGAPSCWDIAGASQDGLTWDPTTWGNALGTTAAIPTYWGWQQNSYFRWSNGDYMNYSDPGYEATPLHPYVGWTLELPGQGIFGKGHNLRGNEGVTDHDATGTVTDNKAFANNAELFSGISLFDNLIQTPLWLDNVLRFRYATTRSSNDGGPSNRWFDGEHQPASDWGIRRPLTTSLISFVPTVARQKKVYLDGNVVIDTNQKISSKAIERRNLAYLFLASCKTTPFITCGNTSISSQADDGQGLTVFTDKADHYPKALKPFVTSQGIIKIPKIWVYGIGSVMWRWKTFMGANKDTNGNIMWRHPGFKEKPIDVDPLAQPGHPSVSCDDSGEQPIQGYKKTNGAARTNRSTTIDGAGVTNAGISYMNQLFKDEKGLWTSNEVTQDRIQFSCFAATTTRTRGLNKAYHNGIIYNTGGVRDASAYSYPGLNDSGINYNSGVVNDPFVGPEGPWSKTAVYGAAFDYWGTMNNDTFLNKAIPQFRSLSQNSRVTYSYEDDGFEGFLNDVAGLFVDLSDEIYYNTQGVWTDYYYSHRQCDDCRGGVFTEWTNESMWSMGEDVENDPDAWEPLDLQMRSAREAAAHSYVPSLWICPWQHFYTETVSYDGKRGSRKTSKYTEKGSYVEQVLTILPMDTPYRDYSGNFGYLGNKNSNYTARPLGAVEKTLTWDISDTFTSITKGSSFYNDGEGSDVTKQYTQFIIGTANKDNSEGWDPKETFCMTLEGGKYTELMALLPTFIKEKFVEEFEKWCDGDWKDRYLPVIDPVNFGWEVKEGSEFTPKTDRKAGENNLLGRSYRAKGFGDSFAFDKIIGAWQADIQEVWSVAAQDDRSTAIVCLDKSESDNKEIIQQLEDNLINKHYYAMISTPRVFGLDVFNGDLGGNNNAFYANKILVTKYLESFRDEWKNYYQSKFDELTDEESDDNNDGSILNDDDIKLSLYRSFKSIVDKWISSTRKATNPSEKQFFFNIIQNENEAAFGKEPTPLAGHFSYVNRVMGEIGNKAVLDVIKLEDLPNNPKKSFYNTISDLLGENKFDFFPLPSFTNFTNNNRGNDKDKTAIEMFTPYTSSVVKASGPQFICMYVGGTSRMVDLRTKGGNCKIDQDDLSFNDDGFEISDETTTQKPNEYAKPMSEEPLANQPEKYNYRDPNRIEGDGFTAFRVAYGIENQNMFTNIELDQSEFSETNESLMVIDRLAKGGNPSDRTQKGNNLHNVYLTRAYTAKVESLGNMTIQPLQYFELTNIPMFYGTYLITEVSHNVKPNHIKTNFKGTRQPIATVPVVEDVATAMNQSIRDIDAAKKDRNVLDGGFDAGSGSGDCYTPNSTNNTITSNVPNNVVEGIPFVDVGKDDPSKYYNHAWKKCKDCDKNKPGNWEIEEKNGVKERFWVAYNQPTGNLTADKVEYVVLHWTGGYQTVQKSGTLKSRGLHYTFEIDKDGTLFQTSDLNKVAYHGRPMNSYGIGISYVGGVEDNTNGKAYVRTVNDWNQEDLNLNGRDTFKAKKQFAAIVDACTLAVKKYPNIKYITSHHFYSSNKGDVGNKFPYDILIAELKKRGINLTLKYSGDAPPLVTWTGRQQEAVSGTISDLSYNRDAINQETDGNEPNNDDNNVNPSTDVSSDGTAFNGNTKGPIYNLNEALSHAGQI